MRYVDGKYLPTVDEHSIRGFFGEYRWLSNFHPCSVPLHGRVYPSSEHAYMSLKSESESDKDFLSNPELTSGQANRFGRNIKLRAGWDDFKLTAMYMVLISKFSNTEYLKKALISTGEKYLEETNYWKDTYWGKCDDIGYNQLGNCLMDVRTYIKTLDNTKNHLYN